MTFSRQHSPGMGHDDLFVPLQLHRASFFGVWSDKIFLLWEFIMLYMLGVQLYPSFMVCLLSILLRGWVLGKFLSMSLRNSFPKAVLRVAQ